MIPDVCIARLVFPDSHVESSPRAGKLPSEKSAWRDTHRREFFPESKRLLQQTRVPTAVTRESRLPSMVDASQARYIECTYVSNSISKCVYGQSKPEQSRVNRSVLELSIYSRRCADRDVPEGRQATHDINRGRAACNEGALSGNVRFQLLYRKF